jgi:hypothetical protein
MQASPGLPSSSAGCPCGSVSHDARRRGHRTPGLIRPPRAAEHGRSTVLQSHATQREPLDRIDHRSRYMTQSCNRAPPAQAKEGRRREAPPSLGRKRPRKQQSGNAGLLSPALIVSAARKRKRHAAPHNSGMPREVSSSLSAVRPTRWDGKCCFSPSASPLQPPEAPGTCTTLRFP